MIIYLSCNISIAQDGNSNWVPAQFQQYDATPFLFNPSESFRNSHTELSLAYKMYTNFRRRNNEFYAGILLNPNHLPPEKDSLNRKAIGLFIQSENEAGILHFNRLNALYAYKIQLNKDMKLAAGGSLKLFNYVVDATPMDPGGSDMTLSGNLGVNFVYKKTSIGISSGSIFNSTLRPTREERRLVRHYFLHANQKIKIDHLRKIDLSLFYLPGQALGYNVIAGTGLFVYKNMYQIGASYRHLESFLLIAGLKSINFNNQTIRLSVSYTVPYSAGRLRNSNIWEFQIGYLL